MGVILGLTTYLAHGVLNNFLDTDKAAVPFWAFVAVIVAMDVYYERDEETSKRLAPFDPSVRRFHRFEFHSGTIQ